MTGVGLVADGGRADVVDEPAPEDEGTAGPPRPADPGRSRALGLGTLVGAVAGLWGLMIGLRPLYDNSFLTHLATGRLILGSGSVPSVDPYSFTAAGEPWTVQSWFASFLYAGAEELGGLAGIRLLNGALCALLGVAVWLLTARSRSLVVRVGVSAAVLVPATALWSGRPLLFGLLGLASVLLAAEGRLDPRWLIPIGWIWVNTHGSFPLALLVIGLLAVGRRLDVGHWGREPRVLGWTAVGIAGGLVNPLGVDLLVFPLRLLSRSEAFQAIAEWQAPTYQALVEYWSVGLIFVAVLGLVRRPSWRSALPVVAFGALAVTSARNLAPLLLVLTPVLAAAVPEWGVAVGDVRRRSFRLGLVALAVGALVLTTASLRQPDTVLGAYPEDAVAWMEDEGLWASGSRVLHPDYVGNYREALRGDEAEVFIDDRVDMYPLDVIDDYRLVQEVGPGWQDVLDDREVDAVLWTEDSALAAALEASDGWEATHQDDDWVVFERSG